MRDFVKKHYKILEIVFSVMALLTFLLGNALEDHGYVIQLVPMLFLVGASLLSISSYANMRVMIWIAMGVELFFSILGYFGVDSLYTYTFEWVLDDLIYYEFSMYVVFLVRLLILIWMPSLKKGLFSVYPIAMAGLYFLAAVLEGGISITLMSGMLYYLAFAFLAYDLTPMNRIGIWDGLFDSILRLIEVEENEAKEEEMSTLESNYIVPQEHHNIYRADKLRGRLKREVEQEKIEFVVKGKEFLYDDYEESNVIFRMERQEDKVLLSAKYFHGFSAGVSASMLRKKSVLNDTFSDIGSDCFASVDLNHKSLEEGIFSIWLPKRSFNAVDTEHLVEEMFSFMKVLILLGNAKSY